MRSILGLVFVPLLICQFTANAQDLRPGLSGMAPIKWITIRNTHAPGRVYQSLNSDARTYTQEDTYFKIWLPIVVKPGFTLAVGPHYRTEHLELKGIESDPTDRVSNWKLRSIGVDVKSFIKLDSTSWLINTLNVNQSGDLRGNSNGRIPLTYTFSSYYLMKKSQNKEIGFGLMVNKSNSLLVLPVFVYHYNFSNKNGIEISLPHKIAWRHNITSRDILYVKAEASTRSYFINNPASDNLVLFRRIDVDMGVAYNKQFNRFIGAELFAGYRQNLSCHLPENIVAIRNSGWAATFELYIRPPQGLHNRRRK